MYRMLSRFAGAGTSRWREGADDLSAASGPEGRNIPFILLIWSGFFFWRTQ